MINEIDSRLIKVINETSRVDCEKEKLGSKIENEEFDLVDDLGFDSFLMVQLVIELETEFNVEFDMEELNMENFRKYTSLRAYVLSNISR